MSRALARALEVAGPPALLLVLVVVAWDRAVAWLGIQPFLLPAPGRVLEAGLAIGPRLAAAAGLTAAAATTGFAASLGLGTLGACVFSQSRAIQRSVYPYAVFLQTVPIVGIAPLIVFWFGFGFTSVAIVAGILGLFPILTNVTTGLTNLDRGLLELFEMCGASRAQTLVKLRLPSAVPYLVAGARTSAGLSVVGAIVGEMFAGAGMQAVGLGTLIHEYAGQLKTAELFAAILASTLLGLALFALVDLAGGVAMASWHGDRRMDLTR